jgi:hypothetical protein
MIRLYFSVFLQSQGPTDKNGDLPERLRKLRTVASFVDPPRHDRRFSFNMAFDRKCPLAGGVIRRLQTIESRFDPLVVLSQSINNVTNIIDPKSKDGTTIDLFFSRHQ